MHFKILAGHRKLTDAGFLISEGYKPTESSLMFLAKAEWHIFFSRYILSAGNILQHSLAWLDRVGRKTVAFIIMQFSVVVR